MRIHSTELQGVVVIEPDVFSDARGYFLETYNARKFAEAGITEEFVQDNQSQSKRGVLRGLHYQVEQEQGKLIRVVSGEIFDVVVDLRPRSSSFGKWSGFTLSAPEKKMVWIPKGLAHGFYTLSETAEVTYKVTEFYAPQHERTLLWSDPNLGIYWPLQGEPILSEKDKAGHSWTELMKPRRG
ncbi:MAG TPA: dTDP-4-dehydrorhamnose 3,5-epimerase [Candidatus Acidoferrum sp.]|jgi:dTDP-4-dehydrorhamnose 3,5-epimerase|nr:dTDP-4-dehydrorhamnose 3,5-epimerase [Candidatus Acidoferrum sp.]